MTPTTEQIEQLAKTFQLGNTGYEEDWEDLYLDEGNVVATRDHLDDFLSAAHNEWSESSDDQEINGGYYWRRIQIVKGQNRVALAVIDCGDFRLSYKQ